MIKSIVLSIALLSLPTWAFPADVPPSDAGQAMVNKMPLVMQNIMREMPALMKPTFERMQAIQRETVEELKRNAEQEKAAAPPKP